MNTTTQDVDEEDVISKACELRCDTFLIPDEDGEGPGHWHFNQKYGEGILWFPPLTCRHQVAPCLMAVCGIASQRNERR